MQLKRGASEMNVWRKSRKFFELSAFCWLVCEFHFLFYTWPRFQFKFFFTTFALNGTGFFSRIHSLAIHVANSLKLRGFQRFVCCVLRNKISKGKLTVVISRRLLSESCVVQHHLPPSLCFFCERPQMFFSSLIFAGFTERYSCLWIKSSRLALFLFSRLHSKPTVGVLGASFHKSSIFINCALSRSDLD